MSATSVTHVLDEQEIASSPFARRPVGRGSRRRPAGSGRETELDRAEFEYRLLNRSKKRSAEEAAWDEIGRKGELVGVTDANAVLKRRL